MSYISRNLRKRLTYWSRGAPDGFGGTAWGASVNLKGRWEERTEQFLDAKGDEHTSEAVVYVDRDIEIGGYILNGTSTAADPLTLTGDSEAKEIREYRKIPDLKYLRFERKLYL
jgi:hypothetical protein